MSQAQTDADDNRPRGMGRWAVRFAGTLNDDAAAALKERRIEVHSLDHFFRTRPQGPSTTVVVQAASEEDAKRRVQKALDGHSEFSGFEATSFVPS